ncbi:triacylglycerol lipase [Lyophyllum atratum]|nr:triacylglycerol lipase [Lyophyllum atratum]
MALHVPLIGRLSIREYLALVIGFTFIAFEALLRIVILLLPTPIIRWFYRRSRTLFHSLSGSPPRPRPKAPKSAEKTASDRILNARDFLDLCAIYDYVPEEHVVLTKDGYLLGLHRLPSKKGEQRSSPGTSTGKPVVYLHHGLLMNSEVWVCLTDEERCLPFTLVEQGYDVWLGNNRGNKYSKKSIHSGPNTTKFWDFSIDDFAWHDIPDSIHYILDITKSVTVSYIGFSQGTAQAFAALSIHPQLNEKINVFIALAPALSPAGLAANIVDGLMKASPTLMFLFFGRKAILSSAAMWQSIIYPPIFANVIDRSLIFLFNWHSRNISPFQKVAAYAHLYSFASVKSVVHWFQIMRNGAFQMYDDDVISPVIRTSVSSYRPARFPTRNIVTPVVLMYGDSDSLVDIDVMLTQLPPHTVTHRLHGYEHLDVLWGKDVDKDVIPHVLEHLRYYQENSQAAMPLPASLLNGMNGKTKGSTASESDFGSL